MSQAVEYRHSEQKLASPKKAILSYSMIAGLIGASDVVCIMVASTISAIVYQFALPDDFRDVGVEFRVGIAAAILFVLLAHAWGLYRMSSCLLPNRQISKLLSAWTSVFLLLITILFLLKETSILSRGTTLVFGAVAALFLIFSRTLVRAALASRVANQAIAGRRVVVIGEARELTDLNETDLFLNFGWREIGRVALPELRDPSVSRRGALRCADQAIEVARAQKAEEIVIALSWSSRAVLETLIDQLRASPLPVRLLPDTIVKSILQRQASGGTSPLASVELQRAPLSRPERILKRIFDLVLSTVALVVLSPLLIMSAIAVKLDSRGSIIFRQRRTGFDGRHFKIYKFRTMTVKEDGLDVVQAKPDDARVTRVGRLLRKSSIDELPQLFNVFMGDMSIVGPRPHALAHDHKYGALLSEYAFRHHVKPGISGWAQVNGSRGATLRLEDMKRRVDFDLWYINNWSIYLDIRIVVRTAFDMLLMRAY